MLFSLQSQREEEQKEWLEVVYLLYLTLVRFMGISSAAACVRTGGICSLAFMSSFFTSSFSLRKGEETQSCFKSLLGLRHFPRTADAGDPRSVAFC